jgi:hypothetical protein
MALPSTGYDTATVTNPGSALTDFTLMVDLSTMSASWWAVVDTADGTKGRAAKSDGTELATDWIAFDNGAKTGWLRVKWTGTLAASGSQVLRIYPPNTANSSNAANATYGQYAAYDAYWQSYTPLDGSYADRTSNGRTWTETGTPDSTTGKVGGGYTFAPASTEYLSGGSIIGTTPVTFMGWFNTAVTTGVQTIACVQKGTTNQDMIRLILYQTKVQIQTQASAVGSLALSSTTYSTGVWQHAAGVSEAADSRIAYLNGGNAGSNNTSRNLTGADQAYIGRVRDATYPEYMNGTLDDVQLHSAARSADWIAEEYAQTNANATFWGTWTWNASIAVLLDEEDD